MIAHRETRIVPFAAGLMYGVVADVERYPEFLPWVMALRVMERRENAFTAEMLVGYGALRERYTSAIALDPVAMRIDVTQIKGPFRTLENHWHFVPQTDGCAVEFSIRFEFANRILATLAGTAFEKAMRKMTEAFETRARSLSADA